MDFPDQVFKNKTQRKQSFDHPLLAGKEFGMRLQTGIYCLIFPTIVLHL